jgi:hypothetical protein
MLAAFSGASGVIRDGHVTADGGEPVKTPTKLIVASIAAVGVGIGTAGAVTAAGGSDSGQPIRPPALGPATKAALAYTGGGRVTGTEIGDEDSYYEVEVTMDDGKALDVQLDANFAVVETMTDHDTSSDSGR